MRRIIVILLWAVVSVVLLTYYVIPHHHHGDQICFAINDCVDPLSCSCADHDHEESHHGTDGGTCILEQIVLYQHTGQYDEIADALSSQGDHFDLLQSILYVLTYDFTLYEKNTHLRLPPFLITYHSVFANNGLSLRAPPFFA